MFEGDAAEHERCFIARALGPADWAPSV